MCVCVANSTHVNLSPQVDGRENTEHKRKLSRGTEWLTYAGGVGEATPEASA